MITFMLSFVQRIRKPRILMALTALLVSIISLYAYMAPPELSHPHEFSDLVSGFTSGTVGVKTNPKIAFNKDALIRLDTASDRTEDKRKLIDFQPSIPGKFYWKSYRLLEFQPDGLLKQGTEYYATVHLDQFLPGVPKKQRNFTFKFSTIKQDYRVGIEESMAMNFESQQWQRLRGKVRLNDVAALESFEKLIKARQEDRNLRVSWEESSEYNDPLERYFTIDSVQRLQSKSKVYLYVNGDMLGVSRNDVVEHEVHAMGDFGISGNRVEYSPEQCMVLEFSDPLQPRQSLDNILRIENQAEPRAVISGNTIRIYPQSPLLGEHIVYVSQTLKNAWGFPMNQPQRLSVYMEPIRPQVRMVGNGSILPNAGKLFMPFEAAGTKAVEVTVYKLYENNILQFLQVNALDGQREFYRVGKRMMVKRVPLTQESPDDFKTWKRYALDLSALFQQESGAMYRIQLRIPRQDALWTCNDGDNDESDDTENEEPLHAFWKSDRSNAQQDWDFDYTYDEDEYYGEMDPCSDGYYEYQRAGRNVIASDLGIIVKQSPNKDYVVAVNSLMRAEALEGAEVKLYSFQQQVLQKALTNKEGMAKMHCDTRPFAAVVRYKGQNGYVKLDDGSSLPMSHFEVDGSRAEKGIRGFIYGERGVWRPGDSLFLQFMLDDPKHLLPAEFPVRMDLIDPSGRVVRKIQKNQSFHGIYDFRTDTDVDAPTGFWLASVSVGGKKFSKSIRIETVKPNRLKLQFDRAEATSVIAKRHINDSLNLKARWLHGAEARNLNAFVEVALSAMPTRFEKYPGYVFDDPAKDFSGAEQVLFNASLNARGEARFASRIETGKTAPGFLKAVYNTRVFEEGGDASVDRFACTLSPYETYAGLSIPGPSPDRPILETGKTHEFGVASVSENGSPSNSPLQVRVFQLNQQWWWDSFDDNVSYYLSRPGIYPVFDTLIQPRDGKGRFRMQLQGSEWGRYLVRVTDIRSGHTTGKMVFFDCPWWGRENSSQSSQFSAMLSFSSDKDRYVAGETIHLTVPSTAGGRVYVSVEGSERVLKSFQVPSAEGETHINLTASGDMGPVSYVFVSLIQPHDQVKNDMPMRMYGVIPIAIEDPARRLEPIISASETFAPESVARITVKEKNRRGMAYTLAVVDEGLLDLTRFKTPNPRDEFYQKEALRIKTWDMYDGVIGAYNGKMSRVLRVGGDGSAMNGKGAKANRFKPMVRFIGPFYLEPGKTVTHAVAIPQYVGSVRIMVVAGEQQAYGSAELTVPVKKPLMVLASLPRVLGPGEEFDLPVNVFAMENHVKNVQVQVEGLALVQPQGTSSQSMQFDKPGDAVCNFRFAVPRECGIARIRVRATSGKETAQQDIEVQVRPANPLITHSESIRLQAGEERSLDLLLEGMDGTNQVVMEASLLPVELSRRLEFLIQYPHGCVEQTTSAAFPQLAMVRTLDLSEKEKERISKHMKAAVRRLMAFQTPSGGLAYWPGMNEASEWGSNYAGHFLLEAERAGYVLPEGFRSRWVDYQKRQAQQWLDVRQDAYQQLSQAYRLYVLALSGNAEAGAMNRLRELPGLVPQARWRLAAAYALNGQPEIARGLIGNTLPQLTEYTEMDGTFGTAARDYAMMLHTSVLMKERKLAESLSQRVMEQLNSKTWMSTQSTAWHLLAIQDYLNMQQASGGMQFETTWNGQVPQTRSLSRSMVQSKLLENGKTGKATLRMKNLKNSTLYVRIIRSGIPFQGQEKAYSSELRLNVGYFDRDGKPVSVDKLNQGTDFSAVVSVQMSGKQRLSQVALRQIFPSGWEIRNARMEDKGVGTLLSAFDYQDVRDDQVMTYFGMGPKSTMTFRVNLHAAYRGRFYLPAAMVEAMYDAQFAANTVGKWVEVVPQQSLSAR